MAQTQTSNRQQECMQRNHNITQKEHSYFYNYSTICNLGHRTCWKHAVLGRRNRRKQKAVENEQKIKIRMSTKLENVKDNLISNLKESIWCMDRNWRFSMQLNTYFNKGPGLTGVAIETRTLTMNQELLDRQIYTTDRHTQQDDQHQTRF